MRKFINIAFSTIAVLMVMMPFVTLQGQKYPELDELVQKTENLMSPKISDNGKWVAWYSSKNDLREMVVYVRSIDDPKKQFMRKSVKKWIFAKDKISLLTGSRLEVLNLLTGKSRYFDHVKSMEYLKGEDLLVVHYNEKGEGRLELYNDKMRLQDILEKVSFYLKKENHLFVMRKDKIVNEAFVLQNEKLQKIYSTSHAIQDIWLSGIAAGGYILSEVREEGIAAVYVSKDYEAVRMEDDLAGFQNMTLETSQDDENVFLVFSKIAYPEKENVQIWYGEEKQLGKYIRGHLEKHKLIWNPVNRTKTPVSNEMYSSETRIGKKGFFLKLFEDDWLTDKADRKSGKGYDQLVLWNSRNDSHSLLTEFNGKMVIDPKGNSVLVVKENRWWLFDLDSGMIRDKKMPASAAPYYTSKDQILWIFNGKLILENILYCSTRILAEFDQFEVQIINADVEQTPFGYGKHFGSVNLDQLLIIKLSDVENARFKYVSVDKKGRVDLIVAETSDHLSEFKKAENAEAYVWLSENFNKAPVLMAKRKSKAAMEIYRSNKEMQGVENLKRVVVRYKGSGGVDLSGALYLPQNFNSSLKYPVVTHIYESQHHLTNRYFKASYLNGLGMNEALLLHSGIGIFLPDISYSEKGPALSALESVNSAIDELVKIKEVDSTRLGLVGQSFGGYETSFIAGHSKRFAAYIAGAAVTDPLRMFYSLNKGFDAPEYWRVEGRQYEFKTPLADNPEKYIKNSPIMFAQDVSSPMLLWVGTGDTNVDFEHTRSLFIALRKYRKPVIALLYKDEQHALMQQDNQKDLTLKMMDWWSFYLKDEKDFPWIKHFVKTNQGELYRICAD
ncbi:prolyl oligopeptidase family serine peptidase [Chryseobacterium wangxinyae]|uniref:alpha/beta hydrolase family protein n=1 Tax=Chryseobacterium sp. CY350 TaxID=2997336 RepID=UPI00226E0E04|nr:prolyl oligopeptidase family serine peptidase [Chryseobacterium sp. CY350]MCY0977167.1 prolyl oligopeptidase family serine peptidase [Chryseobacterium sp. CY350]WBZ95812.1 prolyl oligopeptidase family serine peptidase [Chryseobacterium sp. CY350]